MQRTWDPERAY